MAFAMDRGLEPLDILLLQEVDYDPGISRTALALAELLNMNLVYATEYEVEPGTAKGVAILSRYPMNDEAVIGLPWNHRLFNPRCRIALGATISSPIGDVRVFSVHLDNRIDVSARLRQVQTVIDAAQTNDGIKVIGGDFNTANVLWFRHLVPVPGLEEHSGPVKELMQSYGYHDVVAGAVSTNDYLPMSELFPLKLDWIFVNGAIGGGWDVKDLDFSDHHLLTVSLHR